MLKENYKKIIILACLLFAALLSIFVISKWISSPETYAKSITYLDEKRTTVLELTAASTAASTAVTLIPGDIATPVAEKLADMSTYFLVVFCAIFLEKYLLTILGYVAFRYVIPAACLLGAIRVFYKNETIKATAIKLFAFGLAISFVIPMGVKVSQMIESTYETSLETTINETKDVQEDTESSDEAEKQGFLAGIVSSIKDKATEVKDTATEKIAQFEKMLNHFIEALAVLIVTSCIIPILVLLFLLWIVKLFTGININLPNKLPHHKKSVPEIPCVNESGI